MAINLIDNDESGLSVRTKLNSAITQLNDGAFTKLDVTQGSLSNPSTGINLTATWNDVNDTFEGIVVNITNTASAVPSKALNIKFGGSAIFNIGSNNIYCGKFLNVDGFNGGIDIYFDASSGGLPDRNGVAGRSIILGRSGMTLNAGAFIGFNSVTADSSTDGANPGNNDLGLWRDSQGILALRGGGVFSHYAAGYRLYGAYTDSSNYERLTIRTQASGPYEIKPEAAGTGTLRVIHISGLPTSNPGPGILWNNGGTPAIGT